MSLKLNPHEKLELARKVEHWKYIGWMGVGHVDSGELMIRDNPNGYANPAKTFAGGLPGINFKLADLGFLYSLSGIRYVLFIHDESGEQADYLENSNCGCVQKGLKSLYKSIDEKHKINERREYGEEVERSRLTEQKRLEDLTNVARSILK